MIDLQAVRRALDERAPRTGNIHCCVHDDANPSMAIWLDANGEIGVECKAGCDAIAVWSEVRRRAGHLLNGQATDKRETIHTYRDAAGAAIARVVRTDLPNGDKKFAQQTPDSSGEWTWKGPKRPRPLYRLDVLTRNPDATVVICEGEKAAEAAQRQLGDRFVSTTWMGGAGAVDGADFAPLHGRDVIIWPDNDAPGAKAAEALLRRLAGTARMARVVRVDDLPSKADAADVMWTADDLLHRLVSGEEPVIVPDTPNTILTGSFWIRDAVLNTALPYVVKGVFGKGHIIVFWGAPGSGKTFITLEMSCAVGTGHLWRGRRTRKGVVLYIAAESSRPYIENRIAALRTEAPAMAAADVLMVPLALDLLHSEHGDVDRVIAAAKQSAADVGEAVLIVIDTLAVTFGGGDENSPGDMGQYVANVQRIRNDTGAAVLVVHHCGKDEAKGMRGHSALLGAIDAEITIEGANNADRILRTGKVRDGDGYTDLFAFRLRAIDLGVDNDGDPVRSCVVDATDEAGTAQARRQRTSTGLGKNQRAVLAAVEAAGGRIARTDLTVKLKDAGMGRQRVTEALAALLQSGMLIPHNPDGIRPAEVSLA